VFGLSYGVTVLLRLIWPPVGRYGDATMLTALTIACFVNFARNRTLHCALTGPLFLGAAIVALLTESGLWHVDQSVLWSVVLAGVIVAFVVEWRAARGERQTNASGPASP
jgi:undecaprenyl pyrophosphate phosphatase UppP